MPHTINTEEFLGNVRSAIRAMRGNDKEAVIQVWYCKTIQNHKGLFITDAFDKHFYECTYNGNTCELYVDEYVKHNKQTFTEGWNA